MAQILHHVRALHHSEDSKFCALLKSISRPLPFLPPSSSSASRSRYTNSFSSFPGRREAPSFTASHLPPVFLIYTESLNPKRRTFPTFNFNLSPEGGKNRQGKGEVGRLRANCKQMLLACLRPSVLHSLFSGNNYMFDVT